MFGAQNMYTTEQIRALIAAGCIEAFYNDRYWRRLSREIIDEHHGECMMCREAKRLTPASLVHHVRELKQYPELAYSRTYTDDAGDEHMQLMPLCHDCHERIHKRGIYANRTGYTNEEKW